MVYAILLLLISFGVNAATITGIPPQTREDGTPFDLENDLQGFSVYCGETRGNYQDTYKFKGYALPRTEWNINLGSGTSYCVVTTVDSAGRESIYSKEVVVFNLFPLPPAIICEPNADLNGDGIVNAADLAIMKTKFFKPF